MVFKKILTSDGNPIVIGSTEEESVKFPPGFSYRVGGLVYTVKQDVTQEVNSSMREVSVSDGSVEIMLVESITRDLKEPDCEILSMNEKVTKKKVTKKKVIKKKVTKKKTNDNK